MYNIVNIQQLISHVNTCLEFNNSNDTIVQLNNYQYKQFIDQIYIASNVLYLHNSVNQQHWLFNYKPTEISI